MRAGVYLIPSTVVLYILVTISPQPLRAQSPEPWPAVPKEDLLLSEDPFNPGTSAMILERSIYTDDAKRFETHWTRIKIFKEDGTSTADIQIPYDAKSTTLTDIAGRTIRPDGAVVEFNGLVYETTVAKYKGFRYQAKTFTLPGAQPGCIIEYRFTYHWKQNLPDEVRNPSHYIFTGSYAYPSTTWTIREKLFTRHASFVVKPLSKSRVRWVAIRFPQPEPTVQGDGTIKLELSNVAALPEEPAMPPPSFVDSTIHFFYAFGYGEDYWGEFGKEMGTTESTFTARTKYLSDLANDIAPSADAPEVRLRKIYARVQQLRFVSFEHSRSEKEVKREGLAENKNAEQVLKHGYAFSHEINLVFLALARAAGFDAHIAMVSDRRSNQFHPRLPDLSQANASVVQVKLNGKLLFFDPATRYCPYGLLPWFETGTQGFLWDKFGGRLTEVPPQLAEKAVTERTADLILAPDGTIQGTVEISFKGVEALDWRVSTVLKDDAGRRKDIEDAVDELFPERAEVELQTVTGWEESDEPLRAKCKIKMPFFAVSTGRRLIFPTSIFQMKWKPLISPRNRVHPIYFDRAYKTVDRVTIAIPPNYRVEGIPKDASSAEAQSYAYHFARSFSDGSIHAERTLGVDTYYFSAETYRPFWAFLTKARIRDAENVVVRLEEHPK